MNSARIPDVPFRSLLLTGLTLLAVSCAGELDKNEDFGNGSSTTSATGSTTAPAPTPEPTSTPEPGCYTEPPLPTSCAGQHPSVIFERSSSSANNLSGCAGLSCHGPHAGPPQPGRSIDLASVSESLAMRLANTPAEGLFCTQCGTPGAIDNACTQESFQVINLTNPQASLLVTKLNDQAACGDSMPPAGDVALTAAERQCIIDWTLAEAEALSPCF